MDNESFHYRGTNFCFSPFGERATSNFHYSIFLGSAERCQSPLWSFEGDAGGGEREKGGLFSALKSPPSSEPKIVPPSPDVLIATRTTPK